MPSTRCVVALVVALLRARAPHAVSCLPVAKDRSWFIGPSSCVEENDLTSVGPGDTSFPTRCMLESRTGSLSDQLTCFFSLALSCWPPLAIGNFSSRDGARLLCASVHPDADLAVLHTTERNLFAADLITTLQEPHYLLADNPGDKERDVFWLDGSMQEDGFLPPWDHVSEQPNDCGGPAQETCVFLGPRASWFDFPCSPYDPATATNRNNGNPMTAGPEITWEDGLRREHNVAPLCQVSFDGSLKPTDIVSGWIAPLIREEL